MSGCKFAKDGSSVSRKYGKSSNQRGYMSKVGTEKRSGMGFRN
jgi:hypothetical protein